MSTKNDYMMLFVGNAWYNELSPEETRKIADQAQAWLEGLMAQGKAKDGHGLTRDGVTIVGKTGRVVSDGPYAETKEAIGGYLIVQAESMEEAVAIAKSNPTVAYGTTMEIRQINDDCPLKHRAREVEQELPTVAA